MDIACPHCGTQLRAKPEWAGRTAACKFCKGRMVIPTNGTPLSSQVEVHIEAEGNSRPASAAPESSAPSAVKPIWNRRATLWSWLVASGSLAAIVAVAIGVIFLNRLASAKRDAETARIERNNLSAETDQVKDELAKAKTETTRLAEEIANTQKAAEAAITDLSRMKEGAPAAEANLAKARADLDTAERELAKEKVRSKDVAGKPAKAQERSAELEFRKFAAHEGDEKPAKAQERTAGLVQQVASTRYLWRTDHPALGTHDIEITGDGRGNAIKTLSGGAVLVVGNKIIIDGPGTHGVHIRIGAAGSTSFAGMAFTTPCVVAIRRDFTLCADKEGIVVTDQKSQTWKSSKILLDGEALNAFFQLP